MTVILSFPPSKIYTFSNEESEIVPPVIVLDTGTSAVSEQKHFVKPSVSRFITEVIGWMRYTSTGMGHHPRICLRHTATCVSVFVKISSNTD
jgi:hypothetical protein